MELRVLGPVEMYLDGARLDLGTPKQRALVAALALSSGRPVSVDAIVDLLWGDEPPPGVTATLQAYVSGLRKVLEPQRERRAPATVLVTATPGYALRLPAGAVIDVATFEQDVAEVHRLLTNPDPGRADLEQAVTTLDRSLARWTGQAYAELGDAPAAVAERARLDETRLVAVEDRAVAQLALGQHATVAGDLEALTTAHPLRERLWALRALALARSGRQGEALDVLRQVRQVLDDELGIDPGAELRELQDQVLRQDPALAWTPPSDGIANEPAAAASPWPMVGRDRPKEALLRGLDAALAGTPSFAAVTGEPGIGKTRLVAELSRDAQADGATVVRALSSSDDGAPPLWPWRSVLTALDIPFPQVDDDDGPFAVRGEIVGAVVDAARTRPVVLVLEDLHWADPASLRVLLLLTETVTTGQLFVVATWRDHPEPTGVLADVAEAFARRHALRLALTGLSAEAVADVVAHLSDDDPDPDVVAMLCDRTAGNPFFVVEYARLAADRGGLGPLLAAADTPRAVHEVLTRRVDRLPEPTVAMLTDAAVLGRRVDGETLAALSGTDEDAVLEALEPAMAAGLVVEDGIDRYSFAHALVRDTLYDSLSASRRARRHVAAARTLAGRGRAVEEARHWLAAGPTHAGTAWRAAVAAAEVARDLHAHEETAALLGSALAAMGDDPSSTAHDRYDVLMARADAYRWSGRWVELTADIRSAIDAARTVGDAELVLRA
ncbi:MAG: transcriptional regulator, partial [Gordonia sp. (in: high G+C Gram-positive bacteria)]